MGSGCGGDKRRQPGGRCLIIMVKEPRLGTVKTRLARGIGATQAARFQRTVTANIVRRLAPDRRWRTILAVTPDRAVESAVWPRAVPRVDQGGGDLGARMARLLALHPHGPVVLIGSDIPGITAARVARAFDALKDAAAVFGPAEDGGFWLVGIRRAREIRGLFRGVRWSSAETLADTLANLRGRRVAFAERLTDVDEAVAYARAAQHGCCVTLSARNG